MYEDNIDTCDFPSLPMTPIQARLHALMKFADLPLFSDESRMRLLDCYARQSYWLAFWDVFRMAPRLGQTQSSTMYTFMFRIVAQSKNQKGCMTVLRTWIPDMEREEPAVKLEGDLAEAVCECLKVAEPYIEQDAVNSPDMKGEWLSLWRRSRWTDRKDEPFLYV